MPDSAHDQLLQLQHAGLVTHRLRPPPGGSAPSIAPEEIRRHPGVTFAAVLGDEQVVIGVAGEMPDALAETAELLVPPPAAPQDSGAAWAALAALPDQVERLNDRLETIEFTLARQAADPEEVAHDALAEMRAHMAELSARSAPPPLDAPSIAAALAPLFAALTGRVDDLAAEWAALRSQQAPTPAPHPMAEAPALAAIAADLARCCDRLDTAVAALDTESAQVTAILESADPLTEPQLTEALRAVTDRLDRLSLATPTTLPTLDLAPMRSFFGRQNAALGTILRRFEDAADGMASRPAPAVDLSPLQAQVSKLNELVFDLIVTLADLAEAEADGAPGPARGLPATVAQPRASRPALPPSAEAEAAFTDAPSLPDNAADATLEATAPAHASAMEKLRADIAALGMDDAPEAATAAGDAAAFAADPDDTPPHPGDASLPMEAHLATAPDGATEAAPWDDARAPDPSEPALAVAQDDAATSDEALDATWEDAAWDDARAPDRNLLTEAAEPPAPKRRLGLIIAEGNADEAARGTLAPWPPVPAASERTIPTTAAMRAAWAGTDEPLDSETVSPQLRDLRAAVAEMMAAHMRDRSA